MRIRPECERKIGCAKAPKNPEFEVSENGASFFLLSRAYKEKYLQMEKGGGVEGGAAGVEDINRGGISTRAAPEKILRQS